MKLKLVWKMEGNKAILYVVSACGEGFPCVWVQFPNDQQIPDNMETLNEIKNAMMKRIKKSI